MSDSTSPAKVVQELLPVGEPVQERVQRSDTSIADQGHVVADGAGACSGSP
jgi:hypothetical protein